MKTLQLFIIAVAVSGVVLVLSFLNLDVVTPVFSRVYVKAAEPFILVGKGLRQAIDETVSAFERSGRLAEVEEINLELKEEISNLKVIEEENEALRFALELSEREDFPRNLRLVPARVILYSETDNTSVMIRLDSDEYKDMFEFGMPVVYKGNLVGVVEDVGESVWVRLVVSNRFAAPAVNMDTGAFGVALGGNAGTLKFEEILHQEELNIGDTVAVSPTSSRFNYHFILGEISEVAVSDEGLFQSAVIVPEVDVKKLDIVFVVIEQ